MIIIRDVKFDFEMEDEQFALQLYRKWDRFCRSGFVDVTTRLLDRMDNPAGVLEIGRLELDLGTLTEEEFYRKFGKRVEEQLGEALRGVFAKTSGENLKRYTMSQTNYQQLIFYLLHGYRAWNCVLGYSDLQQEVLAAIREETDYFRQFLLVEGCRETLRKRLVFRLEDKVLCHLVTLTVRNEADFMNHYTLFLIQNYSGIRSISLGEKEYREAVWLLVLTYIWPVSRGFVSRKELLRYTLRGLAAHLGIGVLTLITYVTHGVDRLLAGDSVKHELLEILEEIAYEERLNCWVEMTGDFSGISLKDILAIGLKKVFVGQGGKKPTDIRLDSEELRKYLSDIQKRRQLLKELKEEEIRVLVRVLLPLESEFIVSYAHVLDSGKEKGWYEGKAGEEFRYVKWDFIFAVLLKGPTGNLDHKQFVAEVLHRLAAHYGLDYVVLIDYFRREQEQLPGWLIGVLFELKEEEGGEINREKEPVLAEDRQRFIRLLLHPVSCRQLLDKMKEAEIYRLVGWIMPEEKRFILDYAGCLETERERGVFEGQAGGEFHRLKWEFIFRLALSEAFNRKHFTLVVLQELAAHYGLNVMDLLQYFYQHLNEKQEGRLSGLWEVVRELWIEGQEKQDEVEVKLRVENELEMWLMILERYLVTGQLTAGFEDIGALFVKLKDRVPERFRKWMEKFPVGLLDCKVGQNEQGMKFYANLLLWWLENDQSPGDERLALHGMLQAVLARSGKVGVNELRRLLAYSLEGKAGEYMTGQSIFQKTGIRISRSDFPALLTLLEEYRQKEVVEFVRNNKKKFREVILSSPGNKEFVDNLKRRVKRDAGFAVFLKAVLGIEFLEEEGLKAPSRSDNFEALRYWLTRENKGKQQQHFERKYLTDRQNQLCVLEWLKDKPVYQQLWIERIGNMELKRLAVEWFCIEKQIHLTDQRGPVRTLMVRYTLPEYANLSLEELRLIFMGELLKILDGRQKQKLEELLLNKGSGTKEWKESWYRLKYSFRQESFEEEKIISDKMEAKTSFMIEVENVGLVLFSPWFLQLFKRLGMLDEEAREFTDPEMQIRAVFILQALVDGTERQEYEEHKLFLNRLLLGLPEEEALPDSLELTGTEKEMVQSLAHNLRVSWPKMKNTSWEGLQQSFLKREGVLEEREQKWVLTVQSSGIDVLLDSLPWGYSMIKLPWMEKMLRVEWR